ncbi:MAG: hypothetical protein U0414_06005 [Polyangiaceae bacterium]
MMRSIQGLLVLASAAWVTGAFAEPPARDPAAGEATFNKGIEALKKEDWATACAAFEASMQFDPSVGAELNLARCAVHDGKLALAWARFQKTRQLNQETPLAKRKKDVDKFVEDEVAKLEPRLPWVTIRVSAKPADLVVKRDDVVVPVDGLDVEVPIDPGPHTFTASAKGFKTTTTEQTFAEGQRSSVALELVAAPEEVHVEPPKQEDPKPILPTPTTPKGGSPLVPAGAVLAAVGGATLIAAGVTGGLALSDRGALDDLVSSKKCAEANGTLTCASPSDRETAARTAERGGALAAASTVMTFVGGGVVAVGLSLVIVGAVKGGGDAPRAAWIPIVTPGFAGVAAGGVF